MYLVTQNIVTCRIYWLRNLKKKSLNLKKKKSKILEMLNGFWYKCIKMIDTLVVIEILISHKYIYHWLALQFKIWTIYKPHPSWNTVCHSKFFFIGWLISWESISSLLHWLGTGLSVCLSGGSLTHSGLLQSSIHRSNWIE